MSVLLTIRAHKRYAVCSKVRVRKEGKRGIDGLLIELSLDGCRISNVGKAGSFALGDPLTVRVEGTDPIEGRVRWANESTVGLRFDRPLHIAGLQDLIQLCRGGGVPEQRAYGT
ncbi:MAG TPA: PilZ domain-containing protein [Novosphingobium sp.]